MRKLIGLFFVGFLFAHVGAQAKEATAFEKLQYLSYAINVLPDNQAPLLSLGKDLSKKDQEFLNTVATDHETLKGIKAAVYGEQISFYDSTDNFIVSVAFDKTNENVLIVNGFFKVTIDKNNIWNSLNKESTQHSMFDLILPQAFARGESAMDPETVIIAMTGMAGSVQIVPTIPAKNFKEVMFNDSTSSWERTFAGLFGGAQLKQKINVEGPRATRMYTFQPKYPPEVSCLSNDRARVTFQKNGSPKKVTFEDKGNYINMSVPVGSGTKVFHIVLKNINDNAKFPQFLEDLADSCLQTVGGPPRNSPDSGDVYSKEAQARLSNACQGYKDLPHCRKQQEWQSRFDYLKKHSSLSRVPVVCKANWNTSLILAQPVIEDDRGTHMSLTEFRNNIVPDFGGSSSDEASNVALMTKKQQDIKSAFAQKHNLAKAPKTFKSKDGSYKFLDHQEKELAMLPMDDKDKFLQALNNVAKTKQEIKKSAVYQLDSRNFFQDTQLSSGLALIKAFGSCCSDENCKVKLLHTGKGVRMESKPDGIGIGNGPAVK